MRFARAAVFSAIGLGGGLGGGGDPAQAGDIVAASVIDSVMVFPSGAEVARIAKVKIVAGDQRIVFPDLPTQALPGSIRVEGKSAGKLAIGSVDSRNLSVPTTDPIMSETERKRLEDQIEALRDTRLLFEGQVQAAETQRKLLTNLAEMPKVSPTQQGSGGPPVDWKGILSTIGEGYGDAKRIEIDGQVKLRETDRKIKDLQGKLAALAPARQERTEVAVNVTAAADLDAELTVRYQVSAASWTALYDARLSTGSKTAPPKLDLTRRASITQRSGEAWSNVALSLSTTRPSVGAAAPDLATMSVDYVPDAPEFRNVTSDLKPAAPAPMAKAMRRSASAGDAVTMDAVEARTVNADVTQAQFQAIYAVPGRVTVAPTGEMKRVQLSEESIEPRLIVATVPKLEPTAYLYAKLELPKSSALLPGAVSLFRDGTFVGTGQLPLLAPGEQHNLGFGTDDAVRVKYNVLEDKRVQTGIISSSKTDTRSYKVSVKNLHERPISVVMLDNIPVSKQQDVKVTLTSNPQPTKTDVDDQRGVLAWEFKLDPDQEQLIQTGYQVAWPSGKDVRYVDARTLDQTQFFRFGASSKF